MENPNFGSPNDHFLTPTVGASLSNGWQQMWAQIGTMMGLVILFLVVSMPSAGINSKFDIESFSFPPYFWPMFLGGTIYSLLLVQPISYGYQYATLRAARGERVEVGDILEAFKNYGNTVLSSIIVSVLTIVGFIFLIVPGIIVACKLYFVPLLVVDKGMTAMEAINTSWRMTDGHTFTIFALGFVSIFIFIGGMLCFLVGMLPAMAWIQTAFGSMYHSIASTTDIDHY